MENVNTIFHKNELVLLLGHNGSGKSTLLKAMAGLVNFSGEINTENNLPHYLLTGYVFQNPETQIIGSTVWEDVIFGLENLGLKKEEIKKRAMEILKITGLLEFKDIEPHNLSGGQKQKLAISSILVMKPDYLLLDEPLTMLDKNDRKVIKELIGNLKKIGLGIIIATHLPEAFLDISDRVIIMDRGNIVKDSRKVFETVRLYINEVESHD
ncbi:energy-coupling factor ABC transporter ATP-binding protein [Thermosipho melanesiensis]|uniref:ABC transporter related n=2 Tax=Thermosipho melanesiensis TaxID=46541 RepID=A6LP81_THEM4|nr:ABC transporter ATP-binding protein [Thermosipho melanesiensis]ABR31732.1 ABC transporter related [Thermosipho melanesiensis BI429]APT74754.1 ABC transporter [Thermosipho melanesiensis]